MRRLICRLFGRRRTGPDGTVKVYCDRCGQALFLARHVETGWAVDGKPIHEYTYSGTDLRRALSEHHCRNRPMGDPA